ncbi:MAG: hypothetical protein KF908_06775 [Nitrosomonas sp.]|nr:hypothetical protein [Nitrosomonas sp.]
MDVSKQAVEQAERPIVSIFTNEIDQFSKYKLAKAYVRWTRANELGALTEVERSQWRSLFESINRILK